MIDSRRTRLGAALVLALATARLDAVRRTSAGLEMPLHTAVLCFALLGFVSFATTLAWSAGRRRPIWGAWEAVLGRGEGRVAIGRFSTPLRSHRVDRLVWMVVLIAALLGRAVVGKYVLQHAECRGLWGEIFIPLFLVAVDATLARWRKGGQGFDRLRHGALGLAAMVYAVGAYMTLSAVQSPSTTYICPSTGHLQWTIPLRQWLGVAADVLIIRALSALIEDEDPDKTASSPPDYLYIFSIVATISSAAIYVFGVIWYLAVPDDRDWTASMPAHIFWGALGLGVLICLIASAFVVMTVHTGPMTATLIVITSILFSSLLQTYTALVPQSPAFVAVAVLITLLSCEIITEVSSSSTSTFQEISPSTLASRKGLRRFATVGTVTVVVYLAAAYWSRSTYLDRHPIEELMDEARTKHDQWSAQATSSHSLSGAVDEYYKRYHGAPPPGFDKWYQFATERNSVVIDDYDSIIRDLAPFRLLSPHTIRQRTWEAMVNPDHDVAGITIRNGEATVLDNVRGTHRWMLDGTADLISKFAAHLPDMDLAFNLNDEPRVSAYWNTFMPGSTPKFRGGNSNAKFSRFSSERAAGWHAAATEATSPANFEELSGHNIWASFGAFACDSPASSRYYSDASEFCSSCVTPHSSGVFLSDWTASTDVCAQRDLVRQHGFYSSPASFKGSHDLYPIFSQSKAPYYADILYPSPWNWLEKAEYAPNHLYPDPPFGHKTQELYWQGSTSEGFTHHNAWRGFARERFVNAVNDPSARPQLIPLPAGNGQWAYRSLPARALQRAAQTAVHLSDIVRCFGPDCSSQFAQFSPLAPNADFQSHWAHAYLLDLDGAGFSGRFLPFLRSRSLPLKAALFREWYDDRLQAWRHFVPLDLRGHGLWATLFYFAGFTGKVGRKEVQVAPQQEKAEEIATAGKEWAERALRREDMEIYMFRLLLEWGRMTDDRREEIGFTLPE